MADSNKDLRVKISTTADTAGLKQAAAGLKDLGSAADAASKSTQQAAQKSESAAKAMGNAVQDAGKKVEQSNRAAARSANELGENFEKGAAAGRVLREVFSGNFLALGQLGGAIKSIGVLLKTNLIGTLFTLGAVAAQVILPIVRGFNDAKNKIEEATAEAEKLNKVRMDTLEAELQAAGKATEQLRQKFEEAVNAKERLNDAEQAAELAEVRADGSLSEEQKVRREDAIRETFRKRKQQLQIARGENAVETAETELTLAQQSAAAPKRDFEESVRALNELEKRVAERRSIEGRLDDIFTGRVQVPTSFPGQSQREAAAPIVAELSARLRALGEVPPEELDAARKRVEGARNPFEKATQKIEAAATAFDAAVRRLDTEKKTQEKLEPLLQRTRSAELRKAVPEARAADEQKAEKIRQSVRQLDERIQYLDRVARGAHDRGDFATQDRAVAEISTLRETQQRGQNRPATDENPTSESRESDAPATTENTSAIKESTTAQKELTTAVDNLSENIGLPGASRRNVDERSTTDGGSHETRTDDAGNAAVPGSAPVPTGKAPGSANVVEFGLSERPSERHRAQSSLTIVGSRDSAPAPAGAPPIARSTVGVDDSTKAAAGAPPLSRSLVKPAHGSQITNRPPEGDQNRLLGQILEELRKLNSGTRGGSINDFGGALQKQGDVVASGLSALNDATRKIAKEAEVAKRQLANSRA